MWVVFRINEIRAAPTKWSWAVQASQAAFCWVKCDWLINCCYFVSSQGEGMGGPDARRVDLLDRLSQWPAGTHTGKHDKHTPLNRSVRFEFLTFSECRN